MWLHLGLDLGQRLCLELGLGPGRRLHLDLVLRLGLSLHLCLWRCWCHRHRLPLTHAASPSPPTWRRGL